MASGTDIENTKRLVDQNKKDNQQLIKKNRSKLVSPGLLPIGTASIILGVVHTIVDIYDSV